MNTSQIIRRTRDILNAGASVGSGPWSDDDLLRFADLATGWLISEEMRRSPLAFARVATMSDLGVEAEEVYSGISRMVLPDFVARVIRLEFENFTSVPFIGSLDDFGTTTRGQARECPPFQALMGQNNVVWFRGLSATSALDLRLWYAHRPAPLARFLATEGTTTTIVADVSAVGETTGRVEDDAALGRLDWIADRYVDAIFEVTSANGALPIGEIRRATTCTLGTYPDITFGFDEAFSDAIEEGDTIDMIPQVDPLHHELICYDAAIRALELLGTTGRMEAIVKTRRELANVWTYQTSTRQDATAPKVRRSE